jgi:hypothetical protein
MKTRSIALLLIALFTLLCIAPAFAQDATREPTAESTASARLPTPAAPSSDGSLWGYVLVIGGVLVGGIVTISLVLQGVGNRAEAAARNPLEMAVIEKGFDSIPSAVLDGLITPLRQSLERSDAALKQVIGLLEKATDKIPETSKTVDPSTLPPMSTLTRPMPLADDTSD